MLRGWKVVIVLAGQCGRRLIRGWLWQLGLRRALGRYSLSWCSLLWRDPSVLWLRCIGSARVDVIALLGMGMDFWVELLLAEWVAGRLMAMGDILARGMEMVTGMELEVDIHSRAGKETDMLDFRGV